MPVFLKDDKKVLFVHVPKTGGTTVERLFQRSGYVVKFRETAKMAPRMASVRRVSPQHLHAEVLQTMFLVDRFDLVFMLVRHPVARFRSEYGMRNNKNMRTDAGAVDKWARKAFKRYAEDPYVFDNHLRPQHEFLLPRTRVFRLEDGMEAAVKTIDKEYDLGLASEIPHELNREHSTGISTKDVKVSDSLDARLRKFYADDFAAFGY
jgi:hypothetical protein